MKTSFVRLVCVFLLLTLIASACNDEETQQQLPEDETIGTLELIQSNSLDVPEPSGLCFGPDAQSLLVVSDQTAMVYEIDFNGDILRSLNYSGEDLEGVAYNPDKQIIAIVEERLRNVILLDYITSEIIAEEHLDISTSISNKGLEGIAWNANSNAYYILNEASPGLLILWQSNGGLINSTELNFAGDYSGIFVDVENSWLWILSDESKSLYRCDYKGNVLLKYPLGKSSYEGVAVDYSAGIVYLANDSEAKLDVFKLIK